MFRFRRREESGDVFGFKWKMSYPEASKIASGRMKKDEKSSVFGRPEYQIENPKEPPGASSVRLSFFDGELYLVTASFTFDNNREFKEKMDGIVEILEAKHSGAKVSHSRTEDEKAAIYDFHYRDEAGVIVENPYNLEMITIFGSEGTSDTFYALFISYFFYGASQIEEHIEKLKNEKEFGGF